MMPAFTQKMEPPDVALKQVDWIACLSCERWYREYCISQQADEQFLLWQVGANVIIETIVQVLHVCKLDTTKRYGSTILRHI